MGSEMCIRDSFNLMTSQIEPPDLLIYLKADISTLVSHIQGRGREYEGSISLDYLKRLNERYDAWIETYDAGNLLVIDANEVDFKNRPEDLGMVVKFGARGIAWVVSVKGLMNVEYPISNIHW